MANHFKLSWINCLEWKIIALLVARVVPDKSRGVLTIYQGSYPFLNETFKDFSRTFKAIFPIHSIQDSIQCKKGPWVLNCLFHFFHNMSNFILKDFLCLLLSLWSSVHWNSRTFQHWPQLSRTLRTFKDLNFYFKIQGLSRTFKNFRTIHIIIDKIWKT